MNADADSFTRLGFVGKTGLEIHFALAITAGEFMSVSDFVRPTLLDSERITGYIRSDGRMYDTAAVRAAPYDLQDPGELGVELLSNDPDLNLENEVSYDVSFELPGVQTVFAAFSIVGLPPDGTPQYLADFAPGPQQPMTGEIRRGFTPWYVLVSTNPPLMQAMDPNGPVGPPQPADLFTGVISSVAFDPQDVGFDVVLIIGQSNAVGWVAGAKALDTVYLDPAEGRIAQWPSSGSYAALGRPIQAIDPLFQPAGQQTGCVGPGMPFARELVRKLKSNRKVLLVPCAVSGTGFSTSSQGSPPAGYVTVAGGGWDPSGGQGGINLYENAIAATNAALASGANNRIHSAIWVQGEADRSNLTGSQYQAKLDALIDGLRARLTGASNMLFLIGQMVPEGIALNAGEQALNAVQIDTPRRKVLSAFSYGAVGHNDGLGTPIHFDNEGQRLNGVSIAGVVDLATANVTGVDPVTPGAVSLAQSTTSLVASWVRTAGRVTDYNVRYRVNGGSWTTLTRTQSIDNNATIAGLSFGNAVDVQVQSVNERSVSAWTASASITLIYPANQPTLALGTPTLGTIPFTITAPSVDGTHSAATSYLVEYKTHVGSTWSTYATVTALTGAVSGLASATQYDVRATPINAAGSGTVSATQTATTATPAAPIDDVGASSYRAFGLRKLRAAYAGSAIRVRYTDSTEADIGFTGSGDLDTVTLLAGTAAHGGSAWIKTWYDQSGNTRNGTQTTTTKQARIVNSNVVDTKNSKPSALFASSNYDDSTNFGLWAAGAFSLLAVFSSTASTTTTLVAERGGSSNYNVAFHSSSAGNAMRITMTDDAAVAFVSHTGAVLANATLAQLSVVDTGTSVQNWVDNATVAATTYSRSGHTMTATDDTFGSAGFSSAYLDGTAAEVIEFTSALNSTQRQAGAANQKGYYGTA